MGPYESYVPHFMNRSRPISCVLHPPSSEPALCLATVALTQCKGAEFLSCRCRATSCRSSRTKQIPRPCLHRFAGLTTSCWRTTTARTGLGCSRCKACRESRLDAEGAALSGDLHTRLIYL